jgi:uroporphyrinogen III methyltransferase/synthase
VTPAILCTRPDGEEDPLVARLRELGLRVLAVPTVALEPLPFEVPDLAAYDWVVVTSAARVRHLLDRTGEIPGAVRWAAVGPGTAAALDERGLAASAVPRVTRGAAVAEAIAAVAPLPGLRMLLARADAGAPDLPQLLEDGGALVDALDVYRTVEGPEASRASLDLALADPHLAAVVFASGSAVRGMRRLAASDVRSLPAVTIGPATSEVARREGFQVAAEAERQSVEGLAAAVQVALEGMGSFN